MRSRSLSLAMLVIVAAVSAAATTTVPHIALVKSDPAKDSTLVTVPSAVRLWFNESVPLTSTRVRLIRDGSPVALDTPTRAAEADAPLVVPIRGAVRDGVYTVQWATASKDGHPVQGSFRFTVRRTP